MQCVTCANWTPKANPEMARVGFAACSKSQPWHFYPPTKTCAKYTAAPAETAAKRVAWLGRLNQRSEENGRD